MRNQCQFCINKRTISYETQKKTKSLLQDSEGAPATELFFCLTNQ